MAGGISSEAVPVSVIVLVYSFACLTLCTLLVCLLWSFGERWTFVTTFSTFTAVSTLASIIQQIHYATSYLAIKEAQYQQAVKSSSHPGLAFGGAAEPADIILFYIQFYCYNTMSLNILFWAVQLFVGSWGLRANWLGDWHDRVGTVSRIFSIIFPAFIVGMMQVTAIADSVAVFFIISNITFLISMSAGTALLVLTLYKYVRTRRLVMSSARRGGWWASDGTKDTTQQDTRTSRTIESSDVTSNLRRSIYDKALIARFTVGFVVLAVFEAAIIVFNFFEASNNRAIAASGEPNLAVGSAIVDICLFIPGVTASLVAFLVFGTTKSWRQYRDLVVGGCDIRSKLLLKKRQREGGNAQGLEFQRLPSIRNRPSVEVDKRKEDLENRVRMFARESGVSFAPDGHAGPSVSSSEPGDSSRRARPFHRPFPSADYSTKSLKDSTLGVIQVGISTVDVNIQHEQAVERGAGRLV